MNGFFAIVTLFIAGVVTVRERVEVKIGEKIALLDDKSGFIYSRVALYEASIDDIQMMKEIFNYCTPKEKAFGCTNKNCSTFLFDYETVSLTPLDASDGFYVVRIFANRVVEKTLIVEAGSTSTPSDSGNNESHTDIIPPGGAGAIAAAVVLVVIIIGSMCILYWKVERFRKAICDFCSPLQRNKPDRGAKRLREEDSREESRGKQKTAGRDAGRVLVRSEPDGEEQAGGDRKRLMDQEGEDPERIPTPDAVIEMGVSVL